MIGLIIGGVIGAAATAGTTSQDTETAGEPAAAESPTQSSSASPAPSPSFSPSPSPTPVETTSAPPPVAVPSPDGKYTSQCDYVLGDFSSNTSHGYRLVGGASVRNAGNVGIKVEAKAHWLRLGASPITATKTAKIPFGGSTRINFTIPIDQNTLDLIQAAQEDPDFCGVKVTITDTFGEAH
jgi:hypothetical protein